MQKSTGTRIDSLLEVLNISQLEFANRLKVTSGAVTNWKKRQLGINVINKIVDAYPQISREWLMTGEGLPLKSTQIVDKIFSPTGNKKMDDVRDSASLSTYSTPVRTYDTHAGVPFYNSTFELGFDLWDNDQNRTPEFNIDFKPYNNCTCWCLMTGKSMFPTLSDGCIVALKLVEDFRVLLNDKIYGIVTYNGLRTIKRVRDNGPSITLIPDNPEFSEQTIEKKDIIKVYQVMGSMNML